MMLPIPYKSYIDLKNDEYEQHQAHVAYLAQQQGLTTNTSGPLISGRQEHKRSAAERRNRSHNSSHASPIKNEYIKVTTQ